MQKIKHNTWTDWDWSDASWILTPDKFISPPTSLRFTGPQITLNLCKLPLSLCLPQGKIVTWFWLGGVNPAILHFRNQEPNGAASFSNCYYLIFQENKLQLYRLVNGAMTKIAEWTPTIPINNWYRITLTWWTFIQPYLLDLLRIRVNYQSQSGIITGEEQYDDSANLWAASITNRAGLGGQHIVNPAYYDDTEIWETQP